MRLEGLPMKNVTKIISPAKVNLVLAVGEKRESGFHEVQTIMHSLALHDTLSMRRFDDEGSGEGLQVMLKCESSFTIDPLLIKAEENIAYKAVVELAKALGRTQDETIEMILNKVIPAEAGLGGGSSNAAAALVGAATLWGVGVEDERVQEVASRLGADVSFFLKGGCARLSGKATCSRLSLSPVLASFCLFAPMLAYLRVRPMRRLMKILFCPVQSIFRRLQLWMLRLMSPCTTTSKRRLVR